jgi:hypothetical protein
LILLITLAQEAGQAGVAADSRVTVHEWGTFTSLQAADGVPMLWRTGSVAPLPRFVHSDAMPIVKGMIYSLQRMETPVIYFYSDQEQTVDLTVRLPHGRFTEWYPETTGMAAHGLHWMNFQITPKLPNPELPQDKAGNNYFAARQTDSDFVRSHAETEKFLFYRGVANFPAPLRVSMTSPDAITVSNAGPQKLEDLFFLGIQSGQGNFVHVPSLESGEQQIVPLKSASQGRPLEAVSRAISLDMARALANHGLFKREATAMVQTWKDSWFTEDGLRVLYLLPRPWTDAALPLQMTPAPHELTRVMVGRAELISPQIENDLVENLSKIKSGDSTARVKVHEIRRKLGRFGEAALYRAISKVPASNDERNKLAAELAAN